MYACGNNEERSCNHCCSGRTISIIYFEDGFVALGIRPVMRTRHIVICDLPHSTIFFSTLSHKLHDFRKNKFIEHKMCVLIFSASLSGIFFILRKTERDIIKDVYWSWCKVSVIFV